MQGPSPEPVWYLLVDFKGKPFKRASAQNVSMPSFGSVADFQAAVKAKDAGRHLKGVDLLLVYKNKVAFDAGVEPLDPTSLMDNTDVENVLMVVVPPPTSEKEASEELTFILLHDALLGHVKSPQKREFKKSLKDCYECWAMEKGEKVTRCMLLDMYLPSKIVTGVHLFQRRKRLLAGPLLGLDDLDDWRNGLLLFNPIKEAFDGLRIGFVYDATDDLYRLKLFDNSASFRNMAIIDFVPSKVIQNEMGLNISALPADWRSRQAPLLHENFQFDVRTTFADLEGKALAFKNLNRPFRDCLNLQARLAFKWAEKKGVSVSDFGDYWLDGMPPRVKTMVKTLNSMATN